MEFVQYQTDKINMANNDKTRTLKFLRDKLIPNIELCNKNKYGILTGKLQTCFSWELRPKLLLQKSHENLNVSGFIFDKDDKFVLCTNFSE